MSKTSLTQLIEIFTQEYSEERNVECTLTLTVFSPIVCVPTNDIWIEWVFFFFFLALDVFLTMLAQDSLRCRLGMFFLVRLKEHGEMEECFKNERSH